MGLHAGNRRSLWIAAVVGLVALLLGTLVGCSSGRPTGSPALSGRGTSGPTAALTTATATWSVRCSAQPLPQGWTWYQDARYSFRIAVPPTWRTGTFEYIPDGSGRQDSPLHIHVVDLFGPESVGQAESSGKMRSDTFGPVIILEVDIGAQTRTDEFASGRIPTFHAQPAPVCIGRMPVTQYLFTNSEGDVERAAVLATGPQGYPYTFEVASHAATAPRDGQLFLTVLGTFSPIAAG